MNLEKLLRELRLMKDQPSHRFYGVLVLVLLVSRGGAFLLAVGALLSWLGLGEGGK